ncbi:hypothetical protein Tco_0078292 [Tanacetum coccineum]
MRVLAGKEFVRKGNSTKCYFLAIGSVKVVIQMDQEKSGLFWTGSGRRKERAGSSGEALLLRSNFLFFTTRQLRRRGERQDGFKENVETPQFEREASRALLQMRSLQNRPAKDGRVHIMEPRAREALKRPRDGGSVRAGEVKAGRMQTRLLPSESMLELDSAKMIIDAGSSDNIASTEMVDQLGPEEVKARLIWYNGSERSTSTSHCHANRSFRINFWVIFDQLMQREWDIE